MNEPMASAHLVADKLALIQKTLETQNELLRKLIAAFEKDIPAA